MMFLLGKHAMFGHDPPMYLRSTTTTCFPSPAKVHAAMVEPVPPPRITRSNSSGWVFLRARAGEAFFVLFMRFSFPSDRFILGAQHIAHLGGYNETAGGTNDLP